MAHHFHYLMRSPTDARSYLVYSPRSGIKGALGPNYDNLSPNTRLVGISEWWNEIMDPKSATVCLVGIQWRPSPITLGAIMAAAAVLTGRWYYGERASHFVSRALNVRQNVEQLLKK